uniref:Uncharacterized protein n=1 Tax=Anguilla anguilla TaxID=7936 RepID=A0A0E9V481_ANGAN
MPFYVKLTLPKACSIKLPASKLESQWHQRYFDHGIEQQLLTVQFFFIGGFS